MFALLILLQVWEMELPPGTTRFPGITEYSSTVRLLVSLTHSKTHLLEPLPNLLITTSSLVSIAHLSIAPPTLELMLNLSTLPYKTFNALGTNKLDSTHGTRFLSI